MELNVENAGEVVVVSMTEESLDAGNVKSFKQEIGPVIIENAKVLFDLQNIKFVDSSGLGAMLSCLRTLNSKGGDLKLFGMTKQVRALFELVRMQRIFDIFNTREEALKAFAQS